MIIYGSKAKQLAKENLVDTCPNCGKHNTVDLYVFQNYAHVFWIPFFPIGKKVISQCENCKQVLKLKEMPSTFTMTYENMKSQFKTPVWTFSGVALLAILVTIGVINDQQNTAKNSRLILAPQTGDVFEVKTKDNQYTLYKIQTIEGDSAFIRINKFETNKATGLSELKGKGETAFDEDLYAFTKTALRQMFDNGEIVDIYRK